LRQNIVIALRRRLCERIGAPGAGTTPETAASSPFARWSGKFNRPETTSLPVFWLYEIVLGNSLRRERIGMQRRRS